MTRIPETATDRKGWSWSPRASTKEASEGPSTGSQETIARRIRTVPEFAAERRL